MVKKKMYLLNLLLILTVVFGWLLAASLLLAENNEDKQEKLAAQAEQYYSDRLYMRAVNTYQTAIRDYQTKKNPKLERRILEIYKEAGKEEEYFALAEERIKRRTAEPDEYHAVADGYIESGNYKQAIPVLKAALEVLGESSADEDRTGFQNKYDSIAYMVDEMVTGLADLQIPGDDLTIPYHAESAWGYMTSKVKEFLPASYEEAFPFQGGYAVAKTEGKYVLIDTLGDWYAVDKSGIEKVSGYAGTYLTAKKGEKYALYTYTFVPVTDYIYDDAVISENGLCFVKKDRKWGIIDGQGKKVTDFVYDDIVYNSRNQVFAGGFAVVKDKKGYFLINEQGEEISQKRFVNAKGMEGSWVAVADKDGKWGFTDGTEKTIDYQFEDAHSFSGSLAAVKYGGKWGYIAGNGKLVVEAVYDEAAPFYKGSALVKREGLFEVITLEFYKFLK